MKGDGASVMQRRRRRPGATDIASDHAAYPWPAGWVPRTSSRARSTLTSLHPNWYVILAGIFIATSDAVVVIRLSPALTVAALLLMAVMTPMVIGDRPRSDDRQKRFLRPGWQFPWPYIVLLPWAALSAVVTAHLDEAALQNIACYTTFIAGTWVVSKRCVPTQAEQLRLTLRVASWVLVAIYGAQLLVLGLGASGIISRRSFAMSACIALAYHCGQAARNRKWEWIVCVLLVVEVALSESRTAAAVAILLLIGASATRRYRLRTAIPRLAVAGAVFLGLVLAWDPLRERFFSGDLSVSVGGVPINVEGRGDIWHTVASGLTTWSLFGVGLGPGASQHLVSGLTDGTITQPHSDYLRLLTDLGIVGLALWLIGSVMLVYRLARTVRADVDHTTDAASALLVFLTMSALMITDNPLVNIFVLIPVAVIIGTAIAGSGTVAHPDAHDRVARSVSRSDSVARPRARRRSLS
jgi:O-antigen ligase